MINVNYIKQIVIDGPIFIYKHFNVQKYFRKQIRHNHETYVISEQYIPEFSYIRCATEKEKLLRIYRDQY